MGFYGELRLEMNNPGMLDFAYEPELYIYIPNPSLPFFSSPPPV